MPVGPAAYLRTTPCRRRFGPATCLKTTPLPLRPSQDRVASRIGPRQAGPRRPHAAEPLPGRRPRDVLRPEPQPQHRLLAALQDVQDVPDERRRRHGQGLHRRQRLLLRGARTPASEGYVAATPRPRRRREIRRRGDAAATTTRASAATSRRRRYDDDKDSSRTTALILLKVPYSIGFIAALFLHLLLPEDTEDAQKEFEEETEAMIEARSPEA